MTEDEAKALACALNNARTKFGMTDPAGDELYMKIVLAAWEFARAHSRISRTAFFSLCGLAVINWPRIE